MIDCLQCCTCSEFERGCCRARAAAGGQGPASARGALLCDVIVLLCGVQRCCCSPVLTCCLLQLIVMQETQELRLQEAEQRRTALDDAAQQAAAAAAQRLLAMTQELTESRESMQVQQEQLQAAVDLQGRTHSRLVQLTEDHKQVQPAIPFSCPVPHPPPPSPSHRAAVDGPCKCVAGAARARCGSGGGGGGDGSATGGRREGTAAAAGDCMGMGGAAA